MRRFYRIDPEGDVGRLPTIPAPHKDHQISGTAILTIDSLSKFCLNSMKSKFYN